MNTHLMRKAFDVLQSQSELTNDETKDIKQFIKSLDEIDELADDDELSANIIAMPSLAIGDMLNCYTYDVYGKLHKASGKCTFDDYLKELRKDVSLITTEAVDWAYDFIKDLWLDNETDGNNNDDGTFKR